MRIKLSSDRQTRWTCELLVELATKNGLKLLDEPVKIERKEFSFADLQKKEVKSFKERLESSISAKERYEYILNTLSRIDGVRLIEGKLGETYKFKSTPIVKFAVRGKTLNAYLGLNPSEYVDTKYIYTDVSDIKKFCNYAMRVKVSSERQARWVCELLVELATKNGLKLLDKPVQIERKAFSFNDLKKKKTKSFKERLKCSKTAKERYEKVKNFLLEIDGIRLIESKFGETYKLKNKPVVKLAVRGKTLNAYLGLNPSEYVDTKYIYTDVSDTKKFCNYAMRMRLTSDRQVRWLLELVGIIVGGAK